MWDGEDGGPGVRQLADFGLQGSPPQKESREGKKHESSPDITRKPFCFTANHGFLRHPYDGWVFKTNYRINLYSNCKVSSDQKKKRANLPLSDSVARISEPALS